MSAITVGHALYTSLKGLVSNRVYPIDFPQAETLMTWPAIRYSFVSNIPGQTICGDNGDDESDIRLQIDVVDTSPDGLRTLRESVMAVMESFRPPAINQDTIEVFDADTKTYRAVLEYIVYQ